MPLIVPSGAPLRVYLTRRLSKRLGEPVQAKVIEPVFAFDRLVIPAGAEVTGTVSRLDPVPKMQRASSILAGDFTPLHRAQVKFTAVILPDGRSVAVQTIETVGLSSIVSLRPPRKTNKNSPPAAAAQNGGILGTAKQELKGQLTARVNAKTRGVADLVRGPGKRERLEEFLIAKLPYHPQWVRKGTRFDAVLGEPLPFGNAAFTPDALRLAGSQPPADSVVHARLTTPLNSAGAKQGEKVEAIVSQPLFSADRKLILPEGTRLTGAVTNARAARWFHRGGQLRFSFQNVELPSGFPVFEHAQTGSRTLATLDAAESAGKTAVKVDSEGGVKAVEPKTRFIAPAIALLIAARSLDNDTGRAGTQEGNPGGRTLGGISGFGLLGALAAQSSRVTGSVLGLYGLGWSVYSNIVAKGGEVEFENNAVVDIRFGSRLGSGPGN